MTPYEISEDPAGFVRVVLHGYWSLEVLDQFNDALDALIAGRQARGHDAGPLRLLVDGRDQEVLSRDVIEALRHRASMRGDGVRVAVVVATMLRKLQAERVNSTASRAIFFTEDEALDWLLAGR